MKKLIGTALCTLLVFTGTFAQVDPNAWCASDRMMQEAFKRQPELKDAYYASLLLQNSRTDNPLVAAGNKSNHHYRIPVVFHIIHQYGSENVSDSEVYTEMQVINDQFLGNDPDSVNLVDEFVNLHSNTNIEFVLASIDPDGNCTNGIDHIYSHETQAGDDFSKLNQWNRANYLNIWITDNLGVSGAAAYAYRPASTDGPGFWIDGIISNDAYVNGGDGNTLTHEIGHYLNLPHVFGDSDLINDGPTICNDDGIEDTPPTKGHLSCPNGYPASWITCSTQAIEDTLGTYTFDSIVPTSGMIDPTPVPVPQLSETDTTVGVIYNNFTAVGVGANPTTTGTFGFDGWDTGAANGETVYMNLTGNINTSKYYEFTITPEARQGLELDDIRFDVARDLEGPRTYSVRWSEDGYASNLPINTIANPDIFVDATNDIFFISADYDSTELGSVVEFGGLNFNSTAVLTFRIYAWNAEDATGDFIVDNVMVNGTFGFVEDVQNYMDYSNCNYHYSPGQAEVMHIALIEIAGQRNELVDSLTPIITGVDIQTLPQTDLTVPLCTPVADFDMRANSTSTRQVCVGESVSFEDHSWNAVIDSRDWIFEDGTMSGTPTNPLVIFSSPGWKDVTLTVTNTTGSSTETRENYVYVSPTWGDFTGPTSISLENGYGGWFLNNNYEDNWASYQLVTCIGINNASTTAFKLNNYKDVSNADFLNDDYFYNQRLGHTLDELVTPSFDLRNTSNITVTFDYAYATNATQTINLEEKLIIYYSRDCGKTWTPKTVTANGSPQPGGLDGSDLVTGGFAGNLDYTPVSSAEWRTASFTYSSTSADDHTRFKFAFEASDFASNLFIDNINVNGTLSLTSDEIALLDLNVYPNPTSAGSAINVSYTAQEEPVTFTLRDAQGKVVAEETITKTNAMVNQVLNGSENLRSACYFLEVAIGDHKTTRKVVVL
ncbi:MAG: M43 family zinc metalloprotease [Crocinitomicaceae bacterium]|nr:M43 family zinc metalloprotease [Crocinitomicaceae bacterium]